MRRFLVSVSLICLLSASVFSEESVAKNWDLTIGYYGETITHPGLSTGLAYRLFQSPWQTVLVQADIGGYWHPMNSVALFVDLQPGYRLNLPFGLFFDIFAGLGYMHVFLAEPTYQVVSGAVVKYDHPGFPQLMIPASLGIGWNFKSADSSSFAVALRIGGFGEFPVNHIVMLHPALGLTAAFSAF